MKSKNRYPAGIRSLITVICLGVSGAFSDLQALHPLVTEDTATQGKKATEIEIGYEYTHDRAIRKIREGREFFESPLDGTLSLDRVHARVEGNQLSLGLSYGIMDTMDIALSCPYRHSHTRENRILYQDPAQVMNFSDRATTAGLGDPTTAVKWRVYESVLLSFAFKIGLQLPIGDEDRGLGAGKLGAFGYGIATLDLTPVLLHVNAGYIRNQNRLNEREDLWHASLALECRLVRDRLCFVGNVSMDRNRSKRSKVMDTAILAGLIVTPQIGVDIDLGFKYSLALKGLQSPGTDYTVSSGVTVRFGGSSW